MEARGLIDGSVVLQNDFMEASWYEEQLIKIFENTSLLLVKRPTKRRQTNTTPTNEDLESTSGVKNDSYAVSEGAERYFKPFYPSSISAEKLCHS
jgi:hypothetical protein